MAMPRSRNSTRVCSATSIEVTAKPRPTPTSRLAAPIAATGARASRPRATAVMPVAMSDAPVTATRRKPTLRTSRIDSVEAAGQPISSGPSTRPEAAGAKPSTPCR